MRYLDPFRRTLFASLLLVPLMTTNAGAQCTQPLADNPCATGEGSSAASECRVEMRFNPMPKRLRDGQPVPDTRRGIPRSRIICYEGDPRCDFDPDLNNHSCTFRVEVCINNQDPRLPKCDASLGLSTFELQRPSADATTKDAADLANLQTIESLFNGAPDDFGVTLIRNRSVHVAGSPNSTLNQCKGPIELLVPQKTNDSSVYVAGTKRIRMISADNSERGRKDGDSLLLTCRKSTCGDSTVDIFWEQCDDGNRNNGDGCNQACQLETGPSPTPTPSRTITETPTITSTATPSLTPTITETPSHTATAAPSNTPSLTPTLANTPTVTNTSTITPTPTQTPTPQPTATATATVPQPPLELDVTLLAPGGSTGNCRGVCTTGPKVGTSCGFTAACGVCAGGTNAGKNCAVNNACPGSTCTTGVCGGTKTCVGGPFNGNTCTSANNCTQCRADYAGGSPLGSCAAIQSSAAKVVIQPNGICFPRISPPSPSLNGDVTCVTNAECPAGSTCVLPSFTMTVDPVADADGVRQVTIDAASFFLPPAPVAIANFVACISAAADGVGYIDCNGGEPGLNVSLAQDHNTKPGATGNSGVGYSGIADDVLCDQAQTTPAGGVDYPCLEGTKTCSGGSRDQMVCTTVADCPGGSACTYCSNGSSDATPQQHDACNSGIKATLSGNLGSGDLVVVMPLAIAQLPTSEFGPDKLPCTADDTPSEASAAVPVALSTGTNAVSVFDLNNNAGTKIAPGTTCGFATCQAQTQGVGISCATLDNTSNAAGMAFGGGFPALDILPLGDIATTFKFVVQSSTPATP